MGMNNTVTLSAPRRVSLGGGLHAQLDGNQVWLVGNGKPFAMSPRAMAELMVLFEAREVEQTITQRSSGLKFTTKGQCNCTPVVADDAVYHAKGCPARPKERDMPKETRTRGETGKEVRAIGAMCGKCRAAPRAQNQLGLLSLFCEGCMGEGRAA